MNLVERQADASRRLVLKPRLADLALAAKENPHAPCYSWAEAWDEIDAVNESDDDDSSIGEAAAGGDDSMSDSGSDSESS